MTGMRRGEALGLRWADVDLENGRLSVRRALIPTNREVVVSEPKTAKGRRVDRPRPVTVEVLKAQAARQLDEQTDCEEPGSRPVSCSRPRTAPPSTPERLALLRARRSSGRCCRGSACTTCATRTPPSRSQAGIHPKVVSERLGHATVSITLDTYSHAIPALQEEAAALIAGLVFAEC